MLQRYARKIRGRVLGNWNDRCIGEPVLNGAPAVAPNYRLAPQYPFPCAIQDFLASCAYKLACNDVSHADVFAFKTSSSSGRQKEPPIVLSSQATSSSEEIPRVVD